MQSMTNPTIARLKSSLRVCPSRLVTALVAATSLAGCGGASVASPSGSGQSELLVVSSPAPTPVPTPASTAASDVDRAKLGVNVAANEYYGTERTFANLAFASGRWLDSDVNWGTEPASKLNAYGNPTTSGALFLIVPEPVFSGSNTLIRCSWQGSGTVRVDGDRSNESYSDHSLTVTWRGRTDPSVRPQMYIYLSKTNGSDPFRDLDCREPDLATNGAFDQRIINDLKPFGVLRFLDWTTANRNPENVTWATRSTIDRLTQDGSDGIAIEHMVDLANAAGSDAWFTVPWNADETYVRNMAQMVHHRLSSGHRAYFELSNEVWNYTFPVANQALTEGLAENLSSDHYSNGLMRYAEKATWMHKILTDVFKDNPARLVRVVSAQNDNPWTAQQVMGFRDTAQWVDALATAPYFGHSFFDGTNATVTDLSTLFGSLESARVTAIAKAVLNKATALRYGKRYIAYEAGQHIIPPAANANTAALMQRSQLMYDMYARYIADWKSQLGDTITFYSATGSISQYGAWGIREYAGQPLSDAPKLRAVLACCQKN